MSESVSIMIISWKQMGLELFEHVRLFTEGSIFIRGCGKRW